MSQNGSKKQNHRKVVVVPTLCGEPKPFSVVCARQCLLWRGSWDLCGPDVINLTMYIEPWVWLWRKLLLLTIAKYILHTAARAILKMQVWWYNFFAWNSLMVSHWAWSQMHIIVASRDPVPYPLLTCHLHLEPSTPPHSVGSSPLRHCRLPRHLLMSLFLVCILAGRWKC